MRLQGFTRFRIGLCTIWVPESQLQCIVSAIDFLRTHDERMFYDLTKKYNLTFYYHNQEKGRFINLVSIHETYFLWGPEAIASFFVLTLLRKRIVPLRNPFTLSGRKRKATVAASETMMDWARTHSVRADFIDAYRDIRHYW